MKKIGKKQKKNEKNWKKIETYKNTSDFGKKQRVRDNLKKIKKIGKKQKKNEKNWKKMKKIEKNLRKKKTP